MFISILSEPLNILHIIVDDLRPELGAYGVNARHSPNIDALALDGVTFDRAYTQFALCGPSRNSFLTGRTPDRSRTWNFINHFREDHPSWTSLPGMFKKAGFNSFGTGKVYHPGMPPRWDGNKSWSPRSLPYENPCWFYGVSCLPCEGTEPKCSDGGFGPGDVRTCWCEIEALEDALTVDYAVHLMEFAADDFHKDGKGFYLAVGLHKPHLPWQASKKHFDRFPVENITLAAYKKAPKGMPDIAFSSCDSDSPWDPLADSDAKNARRAYYAATSGVDEQVGRLLSALQNKNLKNSTVIFLHGDHGWQLGEHAEWRKNTNFELGTRVPLIITPPQWWMSNRKRNTLLLGERSDGLAELVDLMPTMADFAGIDTSKILMPNETRLDGASLVPLVSGDKLSVKNASFSQYPRCPKNVSILWKGNGCNHKNRTLFFVMGYSIRTASFRYTEWRKWNGEILVANWTTSGIIGVELYDHRNDSIYPTNFDESENENVFNEKEFADIIPSLALQLKEHFHGF